MANDANAVPTPETSAPVTLGSKNAFLQKVIDATNRTVTFKLGNGLEVTAEADALPDDMATQCMLHGISQKIGDAAAGFAAAKDHKGAFGAMQTVLDNLLAGVWKMKGERSDLAESLVRLKMAEDVEAATEMIRALNETDLKAVANHPQVKAEVAKIRAERANAALAATADKAPDLGALFGKKE